MAGILSVLTLLAVLVPATETSAQNSAPPTSRDARAWPFPWDSIWNMPLGDGANYVPADIQPGRQFGVFADEDILILEPNAPLVDVLAHDADWDPNRDRCDSVLQPAQVHIEDVPIPAGFSTEVDNEGTPNAAAAILMGDGRTVVQTQPLHVCGAGGTVVSQYRFPDDDIVSGDGRVGAHGGASMSSIGGTIRVGELVPGGQIRHALKVVIDSTQYTYYDANDPTPGYRWPAFTADAGADFGYGGSNPAVEMGSLLALRPDFDLNSLRTEPARIIADALINYGSYLVDSAGWDAHYFATEFGPDGRVIDNFEANWGFPWMTAQTATCGDASNPSCAWSMDMGDIFSALHAVTNNGPATIGGPGNRIAPCAPAFSDGTGGAPADCSPGAAPPTTASCNGLVVTVNLNDANPAPMTEGDDVVLGTPGTDRIISLGGNDTICAGLGVDVIWSGDGNDVIFGEGGSDYIHGGNGADVVWAGSGADRVWGGPGDDQLNGMGGQDRMYGDAGNDQLQGNWNSDWLYGGPGNDVVRGAQGKDKLFGEAGNDDLYGGNNTDYLHGGPGFDQAFGQRGHDNPLIVNVSGCVAEVRQSC